MTLIQSIYQSKVTVIPPFVPTDLSNLRQWYKADAGITKDGSDLVSVWADQSGNVVNLNLTSTGANRPIWVDSVVDGKPVVRFSGSQLMLLTNYDTNYFTAPCTLFLVFKKPTFIDASYAFTYTGGFQFLATGNPYYNDNSYVILGGAYPESAQYWADGNVFGNWGVLCGKLSATEASIYINNNFISTKNCTGYDSPCYSFGGSIYGFYSLCDFAEVIYYTRELNDTERNQVYNYLKLKYPSLP
jgi:hypothetical protein